jgi:hypothetical protein
LSDSEENGEEDSSNPWGWTETLACEGNTPDGPEPIHPFDEESDDMADGTDEEVQGPSDNASDGPEPIHPFDEEDNKMANGADTDDVPELGGWTSGGG